MISDKKKRSKAEKYANQKKKPNKCFVNILIIRKYN
jgi:hypothetical protein